MEEKDLIPEQDELLVNYLTGEATEEERNAALSWIRKSPENNRYFDELKEIYKATKTAQVTDAGTASVSWETIKCRHYKQSTGRLQEEYRNRKLKFVRDILRYAAFIALAISIGYTGFRFFKNKVFAASGEIWNTVEAPYGSRTRLTMADGSEVWLNAGSNLKYSSLFGQENRKVILDGEAYFDVKTDTARQFIVKTSHLDIKVYGTEFNVKAYSSEDNIQTTLVSGSIILEGKLVSEQGKRSVILEPNQTATFYISDRKKDAGKEKGEEELSPISKISLRKNENLIITPDVNPVVYTSWKDPLWYFESESLLSLTTKFERRFNVKFVFESKNLQSYKFTGTLKDETLEQVLNLLKYSIPIDYRIEGNKVVLSENKFFKNSYDEMLIKDNQ